MLEKTVAEALRLSEKAAQKLSPEIQRHIKTARADIIRVGVPEEAANGNHPLIEEAIVTYCMAKMGNEEKREAYREAYICQTDALRKSAKIRGNTENAHHE